MNSTSIFNTAWLLNSQTHKALRQVYRASHGMVRQSLATANKDRQPQDDPVNPDFQLYAIKDGFAIIALTGVLTKDVSEQAWLIGGTSMKEAGIAFSAAISDPAIKGILFYIDSPGGTVDGTEALAKLIYDTRGKKPIWAFSDGQICSAAYWIGAAADKIFLSGNTVQAGSIGVVAVHVDVSEQDKMFGEKITEITAGKYKRIAGNHAPLSDDGRTYLQDQVDAVYSVFIESLVKYRGVSENKVLAMADGKIFIGQDALEIGLVDGIAPLDDVLQRMTSPANKTTTKPTNKALPSATMQTFESIVYAHCLKGMPQQKAFSSTQESHPALYEDFNRRLKTGQVGELFPGAVIGGNVVR